jgi:hypothetical protein
MLDLLVFTAPLFVLVASAPDAHIVGAWLASPAVFDILLGSILIGLILIAVWGIAYAIARALKRNAKQWAPIVSLVVLLLLFTKFHPIVWLGMSVAGAVGFLWIRLGSGLPMLVKRSTTIATVAILLFPLASGLLELRFLESRFARYEVITLVIGLLAVPLGGFNRIDSDFKDLQQQATNA